MTLKAILIDVATGKALEVIKDFFGNPTLAVTDCYATKTCFKSEYRTSAGTTEIAAPKTDGAIMLTDLIITTDRVASSRLRVFFDDGTRTITITDCVPIDAPVNLAIGFRGSWTGWKNAALKMQTWAALKANVAVGYIKIPGGLEYEEWDALR
jgi:hypothetical protein